MRPVTPINLIIKDLRKKNDVSQQELARRIGTTQQSIALIESGHRKVTFETFLKILDALHESLMEVSSAYGFEKEDEQKVSIEYSRLTDDSFRDILKGHGATIFFDDDDNYSIKFRGNTVSLTDEEYFRFENAIGLYIEYALQNLFEKKDNNQGTNSTSVEPVTI